MVFIFSCDWHGGGAQLFPYRWAPRSPQASTVHGEGCVALPCGCPISSTLGLSEADLLVQEFSCRHGKGHIDESRGLGGNDCPLAPLAMQLLLRNGAETAGLWGLVTKKKDLFLSDDGRKQFKWVIYVQKSISFPYYLLSSHSEVCTGQQGWCLIVIYNVFILDETALCYRPVGRYLFYLILIQLMLNLLPEEGAFHTQLLFRAHLYWSPQSLISRSRCNRECKLKTQMLVKGTVIRLDMAPTEVMGGTCCLHCGFGLELWKKCNPEVVTKEERS